MSETCFFGKILSLRGGLPAMRALKLKKTSLNAQISEKDQVIDKLKQQVEMLQRRIWGKSSERFIQPDPLQRSFDFDGVELLPEEKQLADTAKAEIEQYKEVLVKAKIKNSHFANPCQKISQGKSIIFILKILIQKTGLNCHRKSQKFLRKILPDIMFAELSVINML